MAKRRSRKARKSGCKMKMVFGKRRRVCPGGKRKKR